MTDEERLCDLLLTWEERFEQGEDIPAESLCQDRPDLAPALASRILALKNIAWMKAPVAGAVDMATARSPSQDDCSRQGEQPSIPSILAGRFRLDRLIGEGGFGLVWLGYDQELRRSVAIKVPRPGRLAGTDCVQKFLAEARKMAVLKHPGIVPIYDVVRHEGAYFIVSELIDGIDLRQRLRMAPLSLRECVRIIADIADALHHAHQQGIIHRDIKPANILLSRDGRTFITDFGIAATRKDLGENGAELFGTLAYMSPEQLTGEQRRLDGRSDIYGLGVVLSELLTGHPPIPGNNSFAMPILMNGASFRNIPRRTPHFLKQLCQKCLSLRPEERFSNCKELSDSLRHLLVGLTTWKDWLACSDPRRMLNHLYNFLPDPRKMRLFACACIRRMWPDLNDQPSRNAVSVAERYADGQAVGNDLKNAYKSLDTGVGIHVRAVDWTVYIELFCSEDWNSWIAAQETSWLTPQHLQSSILHDLFGPSLFRSTILKSGWLNPEVRTMAEVIYEQHDFQRMPLLGNALKEAGCDDEELLSHCFGAGPHFKGCWALDRVLEKDKCEPTPSHGSSPNWSP